MMKKCYFKKWSYAVAFIGLLLLMSGMSWGQTPQYLKVSNISDPPEANGVYVKQAGTTGLNPNWEYWKHESENYYIYADDYSGSYYWNIDGNKIDTDGSYFYNDDINNATFLTTKTSPHLVTTWAADQGTHYPPNSLVQVVIYTPTSPPIVTTQAVSNIAATTATGNGTVTATGGANITQRGVYWSTTNGFANGTGTRVSTDGDWSATGAFTQAITGLTAGTTYYVKAFATNSAGTGYGSQVSFTTLAPEISVQGNSQSIADGDATTTTTDHTDFGSQSVCSGTIVRTFTIQNTGNANLTLSNPTLSGTNAADFTVTANPASPVSASGSTTFQVTFNPSASGTRTATISITNNDSDENPYNFSIQGTGTDPEVNVQGNGTSIADGDATPSATDHTDFGSQSVCAGTVVRTFTIQNTGNSNLTLGTVTISGTNAGDFSVTASPSSPVSAAGSTTFQVTFNPSASGTRTADISFTSNDCDEATYNFSIQGTGTDPEVNVQGNSTSIADGDATPSVTDHTDFGSQSVCSGTIVRTFTIQNTGNSNLTLGTVTISGTNAADFSVTASPSSPVSAAGSTTFQVTFNPSASGTRTADISFTSNDCDEATYNFSIQGTGIDPEVNVLGNSTSIADGDATPSVTDHTDFGSQSVYSGTIVRTFTIQNTGDANLTLSNPALSGTNASDFTVTSNPANTVSAAGSTTFQVTFDPSALGVRNATLTIENDDCDENPYNFSIQGTGLAAPSVTTQTITKVGSTNALGNGNIIDLGYPNPTACGICYGATLNPTITDSKVDKGAASATGAFTAQITGLTPGTTYHARAFSTNTVETVYGTDVTFTTSPVMTEPGNALSFDGTDDHVVATDNDNSLTAFTIEAWVKWTPAGTSDVNFICGKGVEQMEIHTGGGAGANGIRFIPTTGVYLDASNVLPVGVWTHVAVVYNPSTPLAKMYINGVEVAIVNNGANPLGTAIANTALPFYLGTRGDASYRFKGSMDEVCVWNFVRSQAEIQADMNNSIGASSSGLINYYKFNEGTAGSNNTAGSTMLPDLTSNGNNGTLTNFALTGATSNWVESGIIVIPATSTFSTDGNWSTTDNWSDGLPGAITDVIINANCMLDDNYQANNFTINSNATVTISSGKTLTVNGNLMLESDATGTASLINNGTLTVDGTTSVERYMTGNAWHLVSSPVSGQTIASFLEANSLISAKPESDIRAMKAYNETTNHWGELFTNATAGNMGGGYAQAVWPDADGTVSLTGTLQLGSITTPVVRNGYGWNCIGNPYPSAIAINSAAGTDNFISLNSGNFEPSYGAIYVWEQSNNAYSIIRLADAAYYAQSGQGFFVRVRTGATEIGFSPALQTHQINVALKQGTVPWPQIRLTATLGTSKSTTVIMFGESMKSGLDFGYDAGIFKSGFNLYSKLVQDNGVDFGIQCLPLVDSQEVEIPIGLESDTEGEVVFSFDTGSLPTGYQVIFEDRETGIFTPLSQGESIGTVQVTARSKLSGRFFLHASQAGATGINSNGYGDNWKVYAAMGQIHILGAVTSSATATLYDTMGREICTFHLQKGQVNRIPCSELKSGIYLLGIRQEGNSFTRKIPVQN